MKRMKSGNKSPLPSSGVDSGSISLRVKFIGRSVESLAQDAVMASNRANSDAVDFMTFDYFSGSLN